MSADLRRLARLHGVQTSYRSVRTGKNETASPETLLAVLRALGAPVERVQDAAGAARDLERERGLRPAPPVAVVWDGKGTSVPTRGRAARAILETEGGDRIAIPSDGASLRVPARVPPGYHTIRARFGREERAIRVISSPTRPRPARAPGRGWGIFVPLYAVRSEGDWGAGSLTELDELIEFSKRRGGRLVATLPLLPTFLGESPFDPSPYAPVSRLFWNEFYLDPTTLPEFEASERARRIAGDERASIGALRSTPRVAWRRGMEVRRRVLEACAASSKRREVDAWVASRPEALPYARFRAAVEERGEGFHSWPEGFRPRADSPAVRFHLWAQWRFESALAAVSARARRAGDGLYLDLPLGVHAQGYDPWSRPALFARSVAGGAPPDHYSGRGQDWGFPPVIPERSREEGHAYFRDSVRHLLRHAGVLRIDHVMSLHRLWWVPAGLGAAQGAYVRYPAEEWYAVLCLEADRAGAVLVGEDLGTVPPQVRPAMRRHGLRRTWAVQRQLGKEPRTAFDAIPEACVAAFNTHDHPTFSGWWAGGDVRERTRLGLIDASAAREDRARRERARVWLARRLGTRDRLDTAALAALGASRAETVIVNLEDLWGETRPQNVPGTSVERPNWRRKAKLSLDAIERSRDVRLGLEALARARRDGEGS